MSKKLPARPNLDHLRRQAKALLAKQKGASAKTMRLADAQLIIATETGFANWPALSRHVQHLRALEGRWRFASLEIDGQAMPAAAFGESALLIDGDRFRMESPEATYEGIFNIDVEATPHHIDIEFIEGPEVGQWSYGIFEFTREPLTLCLGLVGSSRPTTFATTPGSGHALERLTREDASRPARVTGGTRQPPTIDAATRADEAGERDAAHFDGPIAPLLAQLDGEWIPTALIQDGKPMPAQWLAYGSRIGTGNETKVAFGGQTMVHAKVRVVSVVGDVVAIDYLNLSGTAKGKISHGLFEWRGDEACFLMAKAGAPRPATFETVSAPGLTFSRWKRK